MYVHVAVQRKGFVRFDYHVHCLICQAKQVQMLSCGNMPLVSIYKDMQQWQPLRKLLSPVLRP